MQQINSQQISAALLIVFDVFFFCMFVVVGVFLCKKRNKTTEWLK